MKKMISVTVGSSSLVQIWLRQLAAPGCALVVLLASLWPVAAQPTILTTVPANNASGVSPSAPVVITFSAPMDADTVSVSFISSYPVPPYFTIENTLQAWNATTNILTCTPAPAFHSSANVIWSVDGADLATGTYMDPTPQGMFTTSSGGGGGGSGTNAVTSFLVGKAWDYNQTSATAPTLDPDIPYLFSGMTMLASNRTASLITLTIPTTPSTSSNLQQNITRPEMFSFGGYETNLASFNASFPTGNYQFNVSSTQSNQLVSVNLPAFSQPNAPHLTNYAAAQAIIATQPFTLSWDAFSGGGAADYIALDIGNSFQTGGFGQSNALNGTATSMVIPANTLQANSNYSATLGFYHVVVTTNGTTITEAYVASMTFFTINTLGSSGPAPVITNLVKSAGGLGFDVLTSVGQTVTLVSQTNLNTASSTWPVLLTTNSTVPIFHVTDPRATTNKALFYRARNGS